MNTKEITETLSTLLNELLNGAPEKGAYMLNPGDAGLLKSLELLSPSSASQAKNGGAPIAAHVDHLRYGLSLMNRWSAGENPFVDADWSASWRIGEVSEGQWNEIRSGLKNEAEKWLSEISVPREVDQTELNGILGSISHLAYHLGAIRQIDRSLRGPADTGLSGS